MRVSTATYLAISIAAARRVLRKVYRGKPKRPIQLLGDIIVPVKPMTDKQAMYHTLKKLCEGNQLRISTRGTYAASTPPRPESSSNCYIWYIHD